MTHYTYKFRLRPNKSQQKQMACDFGAVRFCYNFFLNKSIQDYQQNKDTKWNKYEYIKQITQLKKQEEYSRLKKSNSQSLQSSVGNLDTAYNKFFKGQASFPSFKKKYSKQSFHIPQFFKIENDRVKLPKYNRMKFVKHREIEGEIKSLTISKTPSNQYYISILVEKEMKRLPLTGKGVGVDLGIKDLAITSDGVHYPTKKYDDTNIKRLQMWLSKKQKGSRRYEQLKTKIAKLHQANANRRNDYLHKISLELVTKYDMIGVENLNVKGMMKNRNLSKSIGKQGWNMLLEKISYKADRHGKQMHKVDRFYPSSKQCNNCGNIKRNLSLKDRVYECEECGYSCDRDINASKNILSYTQRELKF